MSTSNSLRLINFIAICGLNLPLLSAQSSVPIKLETERGRSDVTDVTIIYRLVKEGPKTGSDRKEIARDEVSDAPKGSGQFIATGLQKGLYEFYACDKGLKFEPAAGELRVSDDDNRRLPLQFNDIIVHKPAPHMKEHSQACLIHIQTRCKATREVKADKKGTYIEYRGLDDHYTVKPQACEPITMPSPLECTTPTAFTPTDTCPAPQ